MNIELAKGYLGYSDSFIDNHDKTVEYQKNNNQIDEGSYKEMRYKAIEEAFKLI